MIRPRAVDRAAGRQFDERDHLGAADRDRSSADAAADSGTTERGCADRRWRT
ncbi:hypothetical protein [Halosolutus halophilus]|uniref:hypothetical protein n=1 Tax=Halosolutus halophilus TaxID=1552990 RepID=UPI002234F917|nr:hypothetical protein [Halosolutus halophilus]